MKRWRTQLPTLREEDAVLSTQRYYFGNNIILCFRRYTPTLPQEPPTS